MRIASVILTMTILAATVQAEVKKGENLLMNGRFDADQMPFPYFWSQSSSAHVLYDRAGGPEGGCGAVILRAETPLTTTITARQQGLVLVAGETYKLSAYIKTVGFKSGHAGLIVHNGGWVNDVGFKNLPSDSEWTVMEKTFKLFPSRNKEYGVAMFAVRPTGEVRFADVKLEAVSEGALRGSKSQAHLLARARLIPLRPLLAKIPSGDPKLNFQFHGLLPESRDAYECAVTIQGDTVAERVAPLQGGSRVTVALAGFAPGSYAMKAVVRHKATRETVAEFSYPIRIVDRPTVDRTGFKRLNNLVVEVLNRPVDADRPEQTFTFVNPRDGWVFVALACEKPGAGLAVEIDGRDVVIRAGTERLEAFRELSIGEHRITVRGAAAPGNLVVRSIPEIFDYPPCTNSYVRENPDYDWAFMKKHILHAVTTLNGGRMPPDALAEAKALGLKWLDNFGVAPVDDPVDVQKRMMAEPGMAEPQYDGLTSDELFFGRPTIDNYTKALWTLHNPEQRLVYTWIVGKPAIPPLHTDFMSAALNVSGARGRLLFEAYCHPQPDEAAAHAYLENKLVETIRRFEDYFPDARAGTGIIFGNFNQIPLISLEHDPAVDFKYFLDMQVNMIANDPAFRDLATTGYWGTYYGDEEMVRWAFKLMRHYAVEGRTEMLSKQYGFRYKPGFLENGDFADGLTGWEATPAADGSIRPHTIPGYGKKSQKRWGAGGAGDTVCVFSRQEAGPNRVSQTATGLEVGKAYCLQYVTANLQDVLEKRYNPHRHGLEAELRGADVLPERSYVHIDRRNKGRYRKNGDVAKINLNRVVFRATSPTLTVTFSDEKCPAGSEYVLNFVQLKPYLE